MKNKKAWEIAILYADDVNIMELYKVIVRYGKYIKEKERKRWKTQ